MNNQPLLLSPVMMKNPWLVIGQFGRPLDTENGRKHVSVFLEFFVDFF